MNGSLALVTGGCSGIGLATAIKLTALPDMKVAIAGLTQVDLESARSSIGSLAEKVTFVQLDVRDEGSVISAQEELKGTVGSPDILINCAAIMPAFEPVPTEPDFFSIDLTRMRNVFDVNTAGIVRMCKTFVPAMIQNDRGRVVNISSEAGSLDSMLDDDWPYSPSYRISKTAVNAVTRLLAKQVRGTNVLVNSVCPGWVRTAMGGESATLSPEEATRTILYLATLEDGGPSGEFWSEMRPYGFPHRARW